MGQSVKRTHTASFGTNGRFGHDASKFYGKRLYQGLNVEAKDSVQPQDAARSNWTLSIVRIVGICTSCPATQST